MQEISLRDQWTHLLDLLVIPPPDHAQLQHAAFGGPDHDRSSTKTVPLLKKYLAKGSPNEIQLVGDSAFCQLFISDDVVSGSASPNVHTQGLKCHAFEAIQTCCC
jgi:hypothetical protein